MGNRHEFEIAFVGLKPGIHEFTYEVNDKFFEDYKSADFNNCAVQIKLILEKSTSFMMLKFEVGGKLDVVCDRCGNILTIDLWDEFNMIVKLVENPDEMNADEEDPDIFYVSRTESHLYLSGWLYEFISLSIPMQRMCKESEIGGPQCNNDVLIMLKKMESGSNGQGNALSIELEKLKKNNNN